MRGTDDDPDWQNDPRHAPLTGAPTRAVAAVGGDGVGGSRQEREAYLVQQFAT